jgi:hypothetical protein
MTAVEGNRLRFQVIGDMSTDHGSFPVKINRLQTLLHVLHRDSIIGMFGRQETVPSCAYCQRMTCRNRVYLGMCGSPINQSWPPVAPKTPPLAYCKHPTQSRSVPCYLLDRSYSGLFRGCFPSSMIYDANSREGLCC